MRIAVVGATGLVGRHVVKYLRDGGIDTVEVSRKNGVDVTTGEGLDAALEGVERIVDVTNAGTTEETPATEFFAVSAQRLQRAGARAGAKRIVLLSIVGIDGLTHGYWAAKRKQERTAKAGSVPVSILRSTPFHEFAGQVLAWGRDGEVTRVPEMPVQPVAVEVAAAELAAFAASRNGMPALVEVAGPRRLAARHPEHLSVEGIRDASPDGPAIAAGALLPGPAAKRLGPTFQQWLDAGEHVPA